MCKTKTHFYVLMIEIESPSFLVSSWKKKKKKTITFYR